MYPLYYLLWNIADGNNNGVSEKRALALIDELVECGGFLLNIGGEPLVRKDIVKIVKYATSKDLIVTLRVSGKYLTDSVAKSLKSAKIRAIILPLFSLKKELNDKFLGEGAYENTLKGAKICIRNGINLEILTILTKENIEELNNIVRFCIKIKSKLLILQRPVIFKAAGVKYTDFSPREYKKILLEIQKQSRAHRKKLIITLSHCPFKCLLPKKMEISQQVDGLSGGCSTAFVSCALLPDGEVTPCLPLPLKIGDINKQNLVDIWENSEICKKLRDRENLMGKCGKCRYKMICGGCRAEAFYRFKNYLQEDPACWLK